MTNETPRNERKDESKLASIIRGIKIWWHDERADYFRYSCVAYGHQCLDANTPEEITRFQAESNKAAEKAKYHGEMARKYEEGP